MFLGKIYFSVVNIDIPRNKIKSIKVHFFQAFGYISYLRRYSTVLVLRGTCVSHFLTDKWLID